MIDSAERGRVSLFSALASPHVRAPSRPARRMSVLLKGETKQAEDELREESKGRMRHKRDSLMIDSAERGRVSLFSALASPHVRAPSRPARRMSVLLKGETKQAENELREESRERMRHKRDSLVDVNVGGKRRDSVMADREMRKSVSDWSAFAVPVSPALQRPARRRSSCIADAPARPGAAEIPPPAAGASTRVVLSTLGAPRVVAKHTTGGYKPSLGQTVEDDDGAAKRRWEPDDTAKAAAKLKRIARVLGGVFEY
jgi:hypothetical protein